MLLERHKFTLDEYHRLAETGFLSEDDRVELIEGEVIQMSPIGMVHNACLSRSNRKFIQKIGDRAIVYIQNSIIILDHEPLPDIAILKPNPTDYADRYATASDTLLIVEVADTSLSYDKEIKIPKYAQAGIQEVWIVDLNEELVWVYRNPNSKSYLDIKAYKRNEQLTLLAFQDIALSVNDILGPKL